MDSDEQYNPKDIFEGLFAVFFLIVPWGIGFWNIGVWFWSIIEL